jgi:hypothetical protein
MRHGFVSRGVIAMANSLQDAPRQPDRTVLPLQLSRQATVRDHFVGEVSRGKCTVSFDFAYDGGGMGKGGTGTLSINGRKVDEGRIEKTVPVVFSTDDTFDVGED